MPDQDSSLITAPAVETSEGAPSPEWLAVHRTTAEELETAKWVEGRSQEVAAKRILRQELGAAYEARKDELDRLSPKELLSLIDSDAGEIVADLDKRAGAEREQKRLADEADKQAQERAEAQFGEPPELRQVRHAVGSAYREAVSLDKKIEELRKLNELREDPGAKGWDDQPAELWRKAREGTLESYDGQMANLIQEKQARLQEASFHQTAYHEGSRSLQPVYAPPPNMPVGQVMGNDGQPMPLTSGDIDALVQLRSDEQNFVRQREETARRHPDWEEAAQAAMRAGVDVTEGQAQFIIGLPNGPDVAYYLTKNHGEVRALSRMNNQQAARELIRLSHDLARQNSEPAPRQTQAPKPPSPVGGSSSRVWTPYDESGSSEEWAHRRYQDLKRRGKAS